MKLSIALLAAVALCTSCSSGGGGGVIPEPVDALFSPDAPAPPAASVTLQAGAATDDVVALEVAITGVSGVFSVTFDLVFDAAHAVYLGADEGAFLGSDGAESELLVSPGPGRLIVGLSRVQDGVDGVPDLDAPGSELLLTLRFRVARAGTSRVDFDPATPRAVRGRDGVARPVVWHGGSLAGV
jgi:hypothetical protein